MKKSFTVLALTLALKLNAVETMTMPPQIVGEFVWNELATKNVQEAKNFYNKVFGWEFMDKTMGDMTYTFVKKGNKEFAGIWSIPTEQQGQIPPHWLSYILVENIEQTVEKARQNGATIIKPVQKIADAGLFAIIADPTGAHFGLWQNLKS